MSPRRTIHVVHKLLQRVSRLWHYDWGLSVMLGALIVAMFVLPPVADRLPAGALVVDFLFFLALISGVRVVLGIPRLEIAVTVMAFVNVGAKVLYHSGGSPAWGVADGVLSVASVLLLVWVLALQMPDRGPISGHHVKGAVALYLLLGLLWEEAYSLLERLDPSSFNLPQALQPPGQHPQALLYFSLVTLTTTGYGDVTPATDWARSLTTAESLVGQLFPAILIARLVSLQVADPKAPPSGK